MSGQKDFSTETQGVQILMQKITISVIIQVQRLNHSGVKCCDLRRTKLQKKRHVSKIDLKQWHLSPKNPAHQNLSWVIKVQNCNEKSNQWLHVFTQQNLKMLRINNRSKTKNRSTSKNHQVPSKLYMILRREKSKNNKQLTQFWIVYTIM